MTELKVVKQSEPDKTSGGDGGGGINDLDRRVTRLEVKVDHLATKEDIKDIKIWVLGSVLGGLFTVTLIVLGIVWRFWSQ